jgi:uncharacterized protein (UPF0548 family)
MRISFQLPDAIRLDRFLDQQKKLIYSYSQVRATAGIFPPQFDHDRNSIQLGEGKEIFEAGKKAMIDWRMFPETWTKILPEHAPIIAGNTVAMYFKLGGLWWRNSCRIVYTIDEERRFGFAYGTLPAHIECGEEVFWVEMRSDDTVWYHIEAFSRPAKWYTWLGYPFARHMQKRFASASKKQMYRLINIKGIIEK